MAINNSRYVDHNYIIASMSTYVKDKALSDLEIMNWCQECETRYIRDPLHRWNYMQIPLTVSANDTVLLPCNVYRILDIYTDPADKDSVVSAQNTGAYLHLVSGFHNTFPTLYINYEGTPIDVDSGVPLILKGHENACEAYCIYQMYYADFLTDRISENKWMFIRTDFENKVRAARNGFLRHKTRADMDKSHIINGNMIRIIGDQSLAHIEWTK